MAGSAVTVNKKPLQRREGRMIADLKKLREGFDPEEVTGPESGRSTVRLRTKGGDRGVEAADLVPPTVFLAAEHGGKLRVIASIGGPGPSPGPARVD